MKLSKILLATASLAAFTMPAIAADLSIDNLRARPSLGVSKNSAAFFTVYNHTNKDNKIVSAESTIARKTQLHTHLKVDGVFKMRQVPFVAIPANSKVEFKSGGLHVMLIGVYKKLKLGDKFKLKLNFEHGDPMTVEVPVVKLTGHMMKKGMKMDGMKKKMPAN